MASVYIALKAMLYPGTKITIFAPSFRQSRLIFKEFTRLVNESPYLSQCIEKEPTQQADQCICIFKSPGGGRQASEVKAFPLGTDGGKLRGERSHEIVMDEIVQIPQQVFRSVLNPMLSNEANPMQKVKKIAQMKAEGLDTSLLEEGNSGYIGITSAFYQFNYWWGEMVKNYEHIKRGSNKYSLRFVPYYELPEGFFNKAIIDDARMNSASHVFKTEWLAEWVADSEGAFPMSLLTAARDINVIPKYARDPVNDKGKRYVFGIDIARENDSSALVVVELGFPAKLVFLAELENVPFPEQAKFFFDQIRKFNPELILMDEFGGGTTIRDDLADPKRSGFTEDDKIVPVDTPYSISGKRILKLVTPTPASIEEMNNNAKTLLERHAIKFPDATNSIEVTKVKKDGKPSEEIDLVTEMINQIASVVVSVTPGGKLHYGLPKANISSNPKAKKKDLYSAFVLACKGVYDLEWLPREDKAIVVQGVVRELDNSTIFHKGPQPRRIITPSKSGSSLIVPGGGIIIRRNGR